MKAIEDIWKCGLEEEIPESDFLEDIDLSKSTQNNFIMIIKRTPKFNFFLTSVEFPTIQPTHVEIPMPYGVKTFRDQSTTVDYYPITCTIVMDENMASYREIYDWIHENMDKGPFEGKYSDGSIIHLSAAKKPLWRINFRNLLPQILQGFTYDATSTDTITFQTTFTYEGFYFHKLGGS